ncbi:SLC13 family permease [Haloferax mediterranei ATCC 33500]|uniref:Potassium transporter TrkA n=1 Tax=Haloferax mediterranei (strain ATCC 33500 / DSM 1411 / JCM 8866 / NBRC 14739 / NCIMB 2177 / R-4) TaxID=523841 RepID=I3R1K5_HALMT|nr:SLC13 family permease [Haloferax mediterranei]AFK18115.1 putative transport protein [Haloferax mediterranei ATCC 33500]AHZ22477.1 potassium transporter TrkA [Haloferax mediterranei ATCC 33500]EMA02612.1 putative transport protein [Haloferax mediterranei ATCC 33500]MDX5988205.1 SLC13 family permease [Haloferax mediterranei ATCC 33500]QCQ74648.1 SLC13 family permease [Haloferax mediterranei ATCC 33500]
MVAVTAGMLVVFALVVVTMVLFMTEVVPPDMTAIGVIVALVVLEPWTRVDLQTGLSGFSSTATITILSMFALSEGVRQTGAIRLLGDAISQFTHGNENRLLGAVVGLTGPIAGIVNNTPVVAVFIPMVSDLADQAQVSPSKLLIPLSYASMLGGTLTLIGTATNLVASEAYAVTTGNPPFSMFVFTPLGALVFVVGSVYLLTVAPRLLPERIEPGNRTANYGVEPFLARVLVPSRSPLVGAPVREVADDTHRDLNVDVLDVLRGGEHFIAADSDREVTARDILTVRGDPATIRRFCTLADLRFLPRASVTDAELDHPERVTLVELVVPRESGLIGETIGEARLRERYDATVLAVRRRGGDLIRKHFRDVELRTGDSLLLQTTNEAARYLRESSDFVVTSEVSEKVMEQNGGLSPTTGRAFAIVAAVIGLAALGVVPIAIAALGGVAAMVSTGCLSTSEAYEAVSWNVIFLLAGVIPLGRALQLTGGVTLIADFLGIATAYLPAVAILAAFYLLTGLLANVITPVASVVLVVPVAIDTAFRLGADPFGFAIAVTFGGSTAFMTPIGYQTNLMVYGPGGYRFTDYLRVGAPLQLLLTVVTTVGIVLLWGI